MGPSPSFLIVQTAFTGDVVLATAIVEKLHQRYPDSPIDFLLRQGNEDLFKEHPYLRSVIVWDKKRGKLMNLLAIIQHVRSRKYDYVINVHRFTSSGVITMLSGAKVRIGFDKNPLSFTFDRKVKHTLAPGVHEVVRNQALISDLTDNEPARPRLYPTENERQWTQRYHPAKDPYVCIAPTSVWFTKQFPRDKWIDFINQLDLSFKVYLLGGSADRAVCRDISAGVTRPEVISLAGELTYLESAALMEGAVMNFANDSAPIHFASAVNAPVTAVFCSTITDFGFGPLSDRRFVVETREILTCRPCGLHGRKNCPQGHFKCARTISNEQLNESLKF